MSKKGMIAPSLLSADFGCLKKDIASIEPLVDMWHIDVMDGHFVPNITIGPFVVNAINNITDIPLDVHLMIENPNQYAEAFLDAGSDFLTAHIEAFPTEDEARRFIDIVQSRGKKAGLSVKPKTDISALEIFLDNLDMVLVMSVEPGFGGQEFIADVLPKMKALSEKFEGIISVDGGINEKTAIDAVKNGVDLLVAGSFVFKSEKREERVNALRLAFESV